MLHTCIRKNLIAQVEIQGANYAEAVRVNRQHVMPSYIAEIDLILKRCAELNEFDFMRVLAGKFWESVKNAKTAIKILY